MKRVCRRGGVIHAPTEVGGGGATYFLRAWAAQQTVFALVPTGGGERGCATYFLRAWVAQQTVFALVPTGDPPSQSSGTLMSLRAIPPVCAGTAKGRCYPRSYRGRGGCATYFLRAYAGAPVAQTLRLSLLRCGERPCDTLRALPENVAAPNACWGKGAWITSPLLDSCNI